MNIQPLLFMVFSVIAIASAINMIVTMNPVRSALSLVLCFFASAALWMLLQSEFLSLILILVYVGAVMTLFLFVIMMLNIDTVSLVARVKSHLPIGLGIVILFVLLLLMAIKPAVFDINASAAQVLEGVSNTAALGQVLYTDYVLAFEIAAVILLVAIVAAITLAHSEPRNCKTQKPSDQIRVKKSDRLKIVSIAKEGE